MKRYVTAGIALAVVMCAGCGTVQNFSHPDDGGRRPLEVYGGTTRSVAIAKALITSPDLVEVAWSPIWLPDIVLSVVGDTLTLPVTIPISALRAMDKAFQEGMRDTYFPEQKPKPSPEEKPTHLTPDRLHEGII